jgi:hypothetical protein
MTSKPATQAGHVAYSEELHARILHNIETGEYPGKLATVRPMQSTPLIAVFDAISVTVYAIANGNIYTHNLRGELMLLSCYSWEVVPNDEKGGE